jgi:DNA-binding NarL/FixJ family response regulator
VINILAVVKTGVFIDNIAPFLQTNGIEINKTCHYTPGALELYKNLRPDIVIMDSNAKNDVYSIPDATLIRMLTDQNPSVKIIVMSNLYDPGTASRMHNLNIQGYFYRSINNVTEEMVHCIKTVFNGETCFAEENQLRSSEWRDAG